MLNFGLLARRRAAAPPVEPSKDLDVKPKVVAKQATKDKPKSSNS